MSDQQAEKDLFTPEPTERDKLSLNFYHPRLTMNEDARRHIRQHEMREKYDADLSKAIERKTWVLIRSDFQLWHSIIKHVCGKPVMRSGQFIHLDVYDLDSSRFVQRGVPWEWVTEMWFFSNRPPAQRVRRLGVQSCHGITLLDAEQFVGRRRIRAVHT